MQTAAIAPQLLRDTHALAHTGGIHILLHRNASVPWFILVPLAEEGIWRELFELPEPQRALLNHVADQLSQLLISDFAADKINIAAIGNIVDQLHLHVVGRYRNDPCWPLPVWGHLATQKAWSDAELEHLTNRVTSLINPL